MMSSLKNFQADKYWLCGLIAAVLSLILFLYLAVEVYRGQSITLDETIRQAARQMAVPSLAQTWIYVSFFGSRRFLIGGVIVVLVVLMALKWKSAIIVFLMTMAGQSVLEVTLKLLFKRPRPEPFFDYPPLESYSFPSGHALSSLCFYGILAWLTASRLKSRRLKFAVWMLTATLLLSVGSSRIFLGVHFPSDVLAGFAAAFVWVFIIASSYACLEKKNSQN